MEDIYKTWFNDIIRTSTVSAFKTKWFKIKNLTIMLSQDLPDSYTLDSCPQDKRLIKLYHMWHLVQYIMDADQMNINWVQNLTVSKSMILTLR